MSILSEDSDLAPQMEGNVANMEVKHDSPNFCTFYREGKCRFGDNCFNLHEGESPGNGERMGRSTESSVNITKPKGKKPPLRVAGDVRKRIQWDTALPAEYFTVGYIDRFDGVVERQFLDFKWEHLATVGLDDLAIPQHRIQYFKYKGRKVWDKNERLDHVFGSAGNGRKIIELMKEVDEELASKDPFASSEEESEDENITIHVPSSSRSTQSEIQRKVEELERATHFLCIRVKSEAVAEQVRRVQDYVTERDSDLRGCVMPSEILHVTLAMVKCDCSDATEAVVQLLREFQETIKSLDEFSNSGNVIEAKGLSTFGARVLYAILEVPPFFVRVVRLLQEKLRQMEGVTITNHFDFVPHMTLLKVNRVVARERKSRYINSSLYDKYLHEDFGQIKFDNIHFCIINDYRGPDNFYLTCSKIEF